MPIFYFNCEHVLFVYIVKQNIKFSDFHNIRGISKFSKISKEFGPDRFSHFDVYWIQTNRHPDKLNLYIDERRAYKEIKYFMKL